MRNFWLVVSVFWLYTCGGGGGGSSPTEPKEPAPVSNFTATPTTLIQGQVVTFTSTSTGTITSYAWNVDADEAIEATTATYEHTYTEVGTYSVTLTVTGPGGSNPKTVADMITVSTAAPTPTTETSQTVQEDGSTTISLTATDPNGQAVTFAITTDPTNGTATLSGADVTYTPNANFYGTDSFDYIASNGTYTSNPVTITITVTGEDDGNPTTNDVSATTDEDTAVTVDLDATEIDGDNYSFTIVTQPTNGTLGSVSGNQVEYTPNANWNGTDTFTFEATDDRTSRRNIATATITVNAVNDTPTTEDVSASTDEDTAVDISLDASDVDLDALTYDVVTGASNGSVSISSPASSTGKIATYTPDANWNGTDTFTYKVRDNSGAESSTSTVTITVAAVNDAPIANDSNFSTLKNRIINFDLDATDIEGDNLSKTIVSQPSNGVLVPGTGLNYTYTPYGYPSTGFTGTDSFTFKVNDGVLDSEIKTVSFTMYEVFKYFGPSEGSDYQALVRYNDSNYLILKYTNDDEDEIVIEFDDNFNVVNSTTFNYRHFTVDRYYHNTFIEMNNGFVGSDPGGQIIQFYDTNFNSLTGVIDLPFKAYGLSINNDGDIIVSGGGGGANNAYIRKYDTNGNLLAEKIHTTYTQALPVIQLSNGQYFACMNADLAMLDENFNFVWTTTNTECG